jgi:tRNA dimethylallyltransferase
MPPSDVAPTVIAIFGPTASGKTALAEATADRMAAEVISADSMQVYQGVPILTNQPERATALVAVWPLDHEASVAEYQELAHGAIDAAMAAGRTPVVVGGTGLYLRAALAELDLPPAPPPGLRERWERSYDEDGPVTTHALLAKRDPEAARAVHPNDRRRVVRALELHELGTSLVAASRRLWTDETRTPTQIYGLDLPAEMLAARIEARTRDMFARGVEEEVEQALAGSISSTASQIIGLREVAELSREEAAEAINLRTRQYAAYQRKWMRRIPGLRVLDAESQDAGRIADQIVSTLDS